MPTKPQLIALEEHYLDAEVKAHITGIDATNAPRVVARLDDVGQGRIAEMRHPVADRPELTLVHVTHFNHLFWDGGTTPTEVIEHGVVDPGYRYTGELARAAVAINEPVRRGRVTGTDLLGRFGRASPIDLFGIGASWGGYESLMIPPHPDNYRTAVPWPKDKQILRVHIGLADLVVNGTAPAFPDVSNAAYADFNNNYIVPKMIQRVVIDNYDLDKAIDEAQKAGDAIYGKYK